MPATQARIVEATSKGCICEARGFNGLNRMEIEASAERVQRYINGEGPVHTILPDVPKDQREFLISGTTPKMWDSIFGDEGD